MARGGMMKEFQEVCFEVQPSTLNQPIWIEVKTEFGYQCVFPTSISSFLSPPFSHQFNALCYSIVMIEDRQ